jgi:hypothetical protein
MGVGWRMSTDVSSEIRLIYLFYPFDLTITIQD